MAKLIVDMSAVLSTQDAQGALDRFRDDAKRNAVNESLKIDDTDAKAKLYELRATADKTIGKIASKITLSVDDKKALATAASYRAKMSSELKRAGEVNIDVKTDRAFAQLAKFNAEAAVIADAGGEDAGDKWGDGFTKAFGDKLDKAKDIGPWWTGFAGAIPAISSIGGAALAAAIGLTGMATAGGIAAGVFSSVAIPVLKNAKTAAGDVAAAQAAYNKAIADGTNPAQAYATEQKAIAAAYAGMSPQQITLSEQLGSISKGWGAIEKASAPVISGALQPWLSSVTGLMKYVQPIIADTAPVVKDLGTSFDKLVTSKFFAEFATWVGQVGSKALLNTGNALIGFVGGIVKLLPQFTPLITDAGKALSGWGTSFSTWAGSASARADVQGFMNWFHNNGASVGTLLKNAGLALKALTPGLTAGGATELNLVSGFLGFIGKLPPSLAKPLTEVSLALLTLNKLGVVSVGVKIVGKVASWLTGGIINIGSGASAAGEIEAAMVSGGAQAATAIRAAMVGGGATAGAEEGGAEVAGGATMGTKFMGVVGPALGIALAGYFAQQGLAKLFPKPKITPRNPNSPSDRAAASFQNLSSQPGTAGAAAWDISGFLTNSQGGLNSIKTDWDNLFGGGSSTQAMATALKTVTTDLNVYTKAIQQYGLTSPQAQKAAENLTNAQEQQGKDAKTAAAQTLDYGEKVAVAASGLGTSAGSIGKAFSTLATGPLKMTSAQVNALWGNIKQQDLDMVAGKASNAKQSFVDFAMNALHLTNTQAQDLWNTGKVQNLDMLANKASTTKGQFVDFAMNALHVTNTQASDLWTTMRMQYLDTLAQKGNSAKGQFIDLAKNGFGYTNQQAADLWNTMTHQYLDTLASKAGETRLAFEKTAGQFGLTKQAADKLYGSMHNLASGSPYGVAVKETLSGAGQIKATISAAGITLSGGQGTGANLQTASSQVLHAEAAHAAKGAWISATHSNEDSVPIMAKRGELIVPPEHAASVANHLANGGYKLPGYAAGGTVGQFSNNAVAVANAANAGVPTIENAALAFTKLAMQQFAGDLTAKQTAIANEAAFGGASGGDIANATAAMKYLAQNLFSGNLKAAAGAVASIFGESNWNPESVGTGGFGLIGWTGNTLGLPSGYHGPTGNATRDFDTQLEGIIGFVKASGDLGTIAEMISAANSGASIGTLAELWGRGVERYGIDDVHSYGIDAATSILNNLQANRTTQGGATQVGNGEITTSAGTYARGGRVFSAGGTIPEPVVGFGVNSGIRYSLAENGPEQVIPANGTGNNDNIMQPMTATQGMTNNQLLSQLVTLFTQMPYNLAKIQQSGLNAGVRRGAFGTGG